MSIFNRLRTDKSAAYTAQKAATKPPVPIGIVQFGMNYPGGLKRREYPELDKLGFKDLVPVGKSTNNFQEVEGDRSIVLKSAEYAGFTITHKMTVYMSGAIVVPSEDYLDTFPPDRQHVEAAAGWYLFCGNPPREAWKLAAEQVRQEDEALPRLTESPDWHEKDLAEAERQLALDEKRCAAEWAALSHPYLLEEQNHDA
jgi:hypothetical protein